MDKLVFLEPKSEPGEGYVYIIDNGTGKVKIGKTANPNSRIRTIETQSGISIIQVYVSPICFNYQKLEVKTHKEFNQFRTIGEWFEADFGVVKEFVSGLDFITINDKQQQENNYVFYNGMDLEYVSLETEILNALIKKMNSLRVEVEVSKALHGSISSDLRREVMQTTNIFDNLEVDFEKQISVLMDLGNDYGTIKDILLKRYLESKPA